MSQRNPMNDRYQTDEHRGQTRKSAASAKPKTKAASSVRMQPTVKTKQQKKAEKRVQRAKQAEIDRQYYNPPTAEYKRLRKVWWGLLIGAIVLTALSWVGRSFLPEAGTYVSLGLAYACIIGALYVDFSKIRKVRRAYQDEMMSKKTKEMRAAEKQQKAAERAAKKEAAATAEEGAEGAGASAESDAPKKRGLFGSGFRLSKAEKGASEGAKGDAGKADAASASGDARAADKAGAKDSSK